MQVPPLFGQQLVNRRTLEFILPRAHQLRRLVERHVKFALRPDRLAVHRYRVMDGVNPRAQHPHGLAVDRHPPGQNHLLASAPRGDTRFRQIFLQANHLDKDPTCPPPARQFFRAASSLTPCNPCNLFNCLACGFVHPALAYASFLVLRRPVMRSPAFHWPRFVSSSMRS